jgi:CheY-like chemotaxis protein
MDAILRSDQRSSHTAPLPTPLSPASHLDRPVVLIVDDEPDVGIILSRLFRQQYTQYDIIAATSGAGALEHIVGRRVALVVTDFNLPCMNGLQVIAAIRAHAPSAQAALITAYSTALLEHLCRQHQVDYYLTKPFRLAALEDVFRTALG